MTNQPIGRSGVKLDEVRTHVDAEGNDRKPKGKPKSSFHEGLRRGNGGKGQLSGARLMSTGFGPSKMNIMEDVPNMTSGEKAALIECDDGKIASIGMLLRLAELGLVAATATRGYLATAEGRRVAEILRG